MAMAAILLKKPKGDPDSHGFLLDLITSYGEETNGSFFG
jgi:hypothetical protein